MLLILGMAGAAFANPTDLIKVRMQASNGPTQPVSKIAINIIKADGFKGLYRGVVPTTYRAILLTATQLSSYDHSKQFLLKSNYFEEGLAAHFSASMIAGITCATISAPIDLVKSRYMNQKFVDGKGLAYSSAMNCARLTIKSEGLMALFKGWVPQWVRLGPHTIITFMVLEQLRRVSGIKPV